MDPWDNVLHADTEAYNAGAQEGIEDAKQENVRQEGHRAGYLRGFSLGLEFGFMHEVTASLIASKRVGDNSVLNRIDKRRVEVVNRIQQVPHINSPDIDFDNELRELRGLYKQCGGDVGSFLPSKLTVDKTSEW